MPAGEEAARELLARGAGAVVLTLGERGCLVVDGNETTLLPAPRVQAIDTTGAGDAFVGSLAVYVATGCTLVEAARRANVIAALSVQGRGTQTSFPDRSELPDELFA
jgi:ribokinase